MTRENKLALVVGFALILLVGILVSDHFSAANAQQSADLLPTTDPLINHGRRNPELLRFSPPPAIDDTSSGRSFLPVAGTTAPDTSLRMPDLQAARRTERAGIALPPDEASSLPFHFHEVERGQSLTWIADHYYDDGTLAAALGRFNQLEDNNMLREGMRLRVPPAGTLIRGGSATRSPAAPPKPAISSPASGRPDTRSASTRSSARRPAETTYTVRPGDVLSTIAQREMGSARHWRKLFDHNRGVINDPDRLLVGAILKIPRLER